MKFLLKPLLCTALLASAMAGLSACSPEVGSKEWCADMKEKPKGGLVCKRSSRFCKKLCLLIKATVSNKKTPLCDWEVCKGVFLLGTSIRSEA